MSAVSAWVLACLLTLAPWRPVLSGLAPGRYRPDATLEAHRARLQAIADDAAAVVAGAPPLPQMSRSNTLRLLLAVAYLESGFQRDVDLGLGRWGKGDGGKSFCLMQIQTGAGTVPAVDPVVKAWTGADLVADRRKCFRAGLALLRQSMNACQWAKDPDGAPLRGGDLLSAYTSGTCRYNEPAARLRWRYAQGSTLGRAMGAEALAELKGTRPPAEGAAPRLGPVLPPSGASAMLAP